MTLEELNRLHCKLATSHSSVPISSSAGPVSTICYEQRLLGKCQAQILLQDGVLKRNGYSNKIL